jgi:SAM-dependent methyltransferase
MMHVLTSLLACPACHGDLVASDAALSCAACGVRYPVRDGIPILLPPGFDAAHVHDELDHAHGHAHKQQQAGFYDRGVAEEFEITRPHNAPEAYRWLLAEKFRRGVAHLPPLAGRTVADVCCGSGMDAELLARAGARVIAIDISEGCVLRARERAHRLGIDYLAAVGDVERLPLRDRGVDIAYVHDGLHHLDRPLAGLREMARVAATGVSVNEPAAAFATALAVRAGLALDREDAGNRVGRLRPGEVARELAAAGFDARAERYLMYYRHDPGALLAAASRLVTRPVYRAAVRAADAALGRWGNKLNVTALRRAA